MEFRPNASCFDQTAGSVSKEAKPALRRAGREQGSMLPGPEPLEYAQLGGYQAVCVFYHRWPLTLANGLVRGLEGEIKLVNLHKDTHHSPALMCGALLLWLPLVSPSDGAGLQSNNLYSLNGPPCKV